LHRQPHRLGLFVLALGLTLASSIQAQANLLTNPGFEDAKSYEAQQNNADFNFAQGWQGWYTNSPSAYDWQNLAPIAFPHTEIVREGSVAQEMARSGATFTAATFQTIEAIAAGTILEGAAWVYIENSATGGGRARIGIGSNVGGNPLSPSIVWSDWLRTYDAWQQMRVSATVPAGSATLFIYYTQDQPNGPIGPNRILIDQASLIPVGTGSLPSPTDSPSSRPTQRPGQISLPTVPAGGLVLPTVGALLRPTEAAAPIGFTPASTAPVRPTAGAIIGPRQTATVPPTSTPQPPSATPQPPSATPQPPSATPQPPSATPEPPSATPEPPTSTPQVIATSQPPTPSDPGVCVLMYEDADQNRVQNGAETLLADGLIVLRQGQTDIASYQTNGQSEPFCFKDLAAGTYTAIAQAPQGYGLTTPPSLVVSVQVGTRFQISFGAARGVMTAQLPTPAPQATPLPTVTPDDSGGVASMLGLIVLGAAGLVLVVGVVLALIIRRLS